MKKIMDTYMNIKAKLDLLVLHHKSATFQEFSKHNQYNLLKRIQIVSITLIIIYFYYFIVDVFLLREVEQTLYRENLIIIHILSLVISIIYLFIYQNIKHHEPFISSKKATILINSYLILYSFLGVASSLNSQLLTGNIDAYIIIVIGISALFHIRPTHLFFIFLTSHLCFYIGLSLTSENGYDHITKQINSTATVIVAFLVSFAFYTYRLNAFVSNIQLKEKEDSFRKLFEINPFPLVLTSAVDGRIVEVNNRALEFYGVSKEELPQFKASDFYKSSADRGPIIEELNRTGHVKNLVIEQKGVNGEFKWVLLNYELIDYHSEKCILTGVTDVTDLKKIEAELTKHASTDILTGIQNRRSGLQQLEDLLNQSREEHFPFTLCFVDVNNLKMVNDKYGHAEGDYLIKWTCEVIKEYIEEQDIFFRYGGDEFIIVFPQKTLQEVEFLWVNIVKHLSSNHSLNKKPYPISVSHGLYSNWQDEDRTIEEMIEMADQAMYREKLEIKNGYL